MVATFQKHIAPAELQPRQYALEAFGLTKSYGKQKAVDGVNLQIRRGEIYALLGPNGAGKTTTINMLTTLTAPDSGQAQVLGYDVVQDSAQVRQLIGVTFQELVMDRNLTGRILLDIHGRLYGMPKSDIKARIAELVALVELEEVLDRPVKTYSGGMKRRLEIARGLMTNPQVLFLDEPTVGLDPQNRARIWDYLRYLKSKEGLTILLTTHYMDEAETLADRVGIIDGGKIIAEGSCAELKAGMGADVVTVTGEGEVASFMEVLQAQSWITFVSHHPEENNLQIGLQGEAGHSLKPIINLAEQAGFNLADISISQPSLNDVFLKYTGRRLRD